MLYALQLRFSCTYSQQPLAGHLVTAEYQRCVSDCCKVDKAICNRDQEVCKEMPVVMRRCHEWKKLITDTYENAFGSETARGGLQCFSKSIGLTIIVYIICR